MGPVLHPAALSVLLTNRTLSNSLPWLYNNRKHITCILYAYIYRYMFWTSIYDVWCWAEIGIAYYNMPRHAQLFIFIIIAHFSFANILINKFMIVMFAVNIIRRIRREPTTTTYNREMSDALRASIVNKLPTNALTTKNVRFN